MSTERRHDPHSRPCSSCEHGHDETSLPQKALVVASGLFLGIGLAFRWLNLGPGALHEGCFALATLAGGLLVVPPAFNAVKDRRLDMNLLMVVAVTGAWLVGEGAEGATVVFLFAFSELLESWSAGRARRAIDSLLQLAPETALVRGADGSVTETAAAEVAVGSEISIRSGARIPLDGKVLSGSSSVNQAPITGESVPVEKQAGDGVFAGTINGEGSLVVQVAKKATESTLARIIQLVGEAEEQKAPTQRFIDRFARIYTPAVFIVALLVFVLPPLLTDAAWSAWAYRALVLLVIACPCALVIATPVSIVSGITALARRGVLIKGGAYLEAVGKLRALAVDKTGTITHGRPEVTAVIPLGLTEHEALRLAAAIDAHSEHPLAQAVITAAKQRKIEWPEVSSFQSVTGRGATAVIDGHPHFIGNHTMAHGLGVCSPEIEARLAEIESRGESLAILGHTPHDGCAGTVLAIFAIGDAVRAEVARALTLLHEAGVSPVVMLSGDNQRTVDAIARQAGIDEAHGDLLPEQKIGHIQRLMAVHHHVGMIGDGVNDAPALARASVGIAMGAIGSDTAIETADMALMQDDLTRVADAVVLGRRTLRVIQFNVAFALVIKAVFLLLALTGHTSLWLAILADTGATLLVIANALRLLR
ncbi:MAG: cadmium-translocating P-type ATPase [Prosthecobacter sp.]|jgi:Cd2+/Zn2+-exporting ATPase|uniref:heavy metal translocating P-type ATPase n=1 Tax=Prosthecobacter sp. TaxID=1965333 RepID=UPI0019DAFB9C|nr:heavy metal translocating P-type ATPase [Prosthecobacter sp.]MBE2284649.1 cadmium-translocating P-type ATPase [Prosthecobacter sp.]